MICDSRLHAHVQDHMLKLKYSKLHTPNYCMYQYCHSVQNKLSCTNNKVRWKYHCTS